MSKISVLLAEDHKILREGIKLLLESCDDIAVTNEASSGSEVLQQLENSVPDVVLMDIKMPEMDGIEATRKIRERFKDNPQVLALSSFNDEENLMKMLDAGAKGYVLKKAGKDELITSIKALASGNTFYSSEVSATLINIINNPRKTVGQIANDFPITERETEVLIEIANGLTNAQISSKLFISIHTVDTHRRNLLQKLQLHNTAGLVKFAFENCLVEVKKKSQALF